jgi:hypothetical protein
LACYSDEKIRLIASESDDVQELRAHLEDRKKILVDGQEAFQEAMGDML